MILLQHYQAPAMPTEHAVRRHWSRLKKSMGLVGSAEPSLSGENMRRATTGRLDIAVPPPACGPLLAELDSAVAQWREQDHAERMLVLALAPCDAQDLIGEWAAAHSHAVLLAPARDALRQAPIQLPELAPDQLLVVPRLEDWFLRRRNGLDAVRALLDQLSAISHRCIVGCNSWAWAFLVKATGASMLLPAPHTFAPFDARRLRDWFAGRDTASHDRALAVRAASDGTDVLACSDGQEPAHAYLQLLAARSLGIPWVAWNIWRCSLRTDVARQTNDRPASNADALAARTDVLWATEMEDPALPAGHEEHALLALQALLMHGPLTEDQLATVLPHVGGLHIPPALIRAGFLERRGNCVAVRAAAYPAARTALRADGFPVGDL